MSRKVRQLEREWKVVRGSLDDLRELKVVPCPEDMEVDFALREQLLLEHLEDIQQRMRDAKQ